MRKVEHCQVPYRSWSARPRTDWRAGGVLREASVARHRNLVVRAVDHCRCLCVAARHLRRQRDPQRNPGQHRAGSHRSERPRSAGLLRTRRLHVGDSPETTRVDHRRDGEPTRTRRPRCQRDESLRYVGCLAKWTHRQHLAGFNIPSRALPGAIIGQLDAAVSSARRTAGYRVPSIGSCPTSPSIDGEQ